MSSNPPLKAPPAFRYPQRRFGRRLPLDPPAAAISFVWPGAPSGTAWGSPASAAHRKEHAISALNGGKSISC